MKLFCQTFSKTTPTPPEKPLHLRSQSRSRFWKSRSPAKRGLSCERGSGAEWRSKLRRPSGCTRGPGAKDGERRQFPSKGKRRGCPPWRRDVQRSGSDSPFDGAAKTLITEGREEGQSHCQKFVWSVISSCNFTILCRLI